MIAFLSLDHANHPVEAIGILVHKAAPLTVNAGDNAEVEVQGCGKVLQGLIVGAHAQATAVWVEEEAGKGSCILGLSDSEVPAAKVLEGAPPADDISRHKACPE